MTEQHDQHAPQTDAPRPCCAISAFPSRIRDWINARFETFKSWLFDETACESDDEPTALGELVRSAAQSVGLLLSLTLHLAGVVALGLLLYWHVPAVKEWADHRLAAKDRSASESEGRPDDHAVIRLVKAGDEEEAATAPAFPDEAPTPAPLTSSLPVTSATPCIAVTGGNRISLHRADGTRLWSRTGARAVFSPAGDVALLDRGEDGWAAVDARTGAELPWSDHVGWVPSHAQVCWSPSGRSLCFEWPAGERGRNAFGIYDRGKGRWVVQTTLDGGVGCAETAAWSQDGGKLVLGAHRGALLFDLATATMTRLDLPDDDGELLWEPNGRHLVASGEVHSLADDASLVRYAVGAGAVSTALVESIGPHAEPLGWMDGGRIIVYRTPCSGSYDGSTVYLAEWPSGDLVAELDDFGQPEVSPDGRLVALYSVNTESGGPGVMQVTSLDGDPISLDPRPIVGIPLKWLGQSPPVDYRSTDEPILDWALDWGWSPGGGDLYILGRRGLRSWCLWRWDVSSRSPQTVGREVECFRSPDDVRDHGFELVFVPSRPARD